MIVFNIDIKCLIPHMFAAEVLIIQICLYSYKQKVTTVTYLSTPKFLVVDLTVTVFTSLADFFVESLP